MPALSLYAPDKGRYSRWILGVSAILLIGYGVYSLFYSLPEGARAPIANWRPLGDEFPISWALLVSVVLFAGGAAATWWGINHHRLVDFLHETEVEMTKVSWASREEVVRASAVVVATTVILAIWVYAADLVLVGIRSVFGG